MTICEKLNTLPIAILLFLAVTACGDGSHTTTTVDIDETIATEALVAHAETLEQISLNHPLSRSAGSAGYSEAMDYIKETLADSGLTLWEQPFDFRLFYETEDPLLTMLSPQPESYNLDTDFVTLTYSGAGDVTGPIAFIAPMIPPAPEANTSTDACDNTDIATLDLSGKIAVIQRGSCSFTEKVANAEAQGAAAVLIFNEGQENRTDPTAGILAADAGVSIPAVAISYEVGETLYELYATGTAPTLRVTVTAENSIAQTYNLFAETPSGQNDQVIMIGAHLDSVPEGPGINDNGSGVSAVLEVARQVGQHGYRPHNKIRFAWWGAEEVGLIGSDYYLDTLSASERDTIAMYLNVDSIASHNFIRGVKDGDLSDTKTEPDSRYQETPAGSGFIEEILVNYFHDQQLPTVATALTGQSDYAGFARHAIPFGALSSELSGSKTEAEVLLFGGTAGEPYDSCYHKPCDSVANINPQIFTENAKAIAHFAQYFGDKTAAPLLDHAVSASLFLTDNTPNTQAPMSTKKTSDRYHQDRRERPVR